MYKNWLELLGAVVEGQIYSSRFQDMLLSILPDLKAHPLGKFRVGEFFPSLALFCFTLLVLSFLNFVQSLAVSI